MSDDEPPVEDDEVPPEDHDAKVLVFRNGNNQPIAVPAAIVTEAERAYRCWQMRIGGKSWSEIALEEQYPSPGAAKADVDRYMAEARSLVAEASMKEALTLEVARLDALQAAVWPQAMAGHVPSATFVMNNVMNRAKLQGLDPEKMAEAAQEARTVVVPTDSASYIAELKKHAEPDKP